MTFRNASDAMLTLWGTATGTRPVHFFEGDFGDDGFFRVWTGYHDVTVFGETWKGAGELIGVSNIQETQRGRTDSVTVTLGSNDQFEAREVIPYAVRARYTGKRGKVFEGFQRDDGSIAPSPVLLYEGEISTVDPVGRKTASGAPFFVVEAVLVEEAGDEDRSNRHRVTAESQRLIDPDDRGLRFLARIGQLKVNFGQRFARREKED
jgi:hypothetical protein